MALPLTKRWVIAPGAPPEVLAKYRGIHPIMAQVLYNRGLTDPEMAFKFLYAKDTSFNPFQLTDMHKAIGRLRQAIKNREPIVVYGDFDADGVTSTALLVETLAAFGALVKPYIPHRIDEGYGLNSPALQQLAKEGVRVVVTVDCGIRSVQEIEDGNAAGLDIIVTDHHSLGVDLPDAYAVINPKREGYPEDMLAGVGVSYKVAQALAMAESKNGRRGERRDFDPDTLLDLVAIGTVADLMPLNRMENRALVRRGLQLLNRARRPGVRALLDVAGIEPGKVTTSSIGFGIGPRINAAGRLDDAILAYNLLTAPTQEGAIHWANKLQELNLKRQDITRAAQEKIRDTLVHDFDTPLIIASDPSFEPGIVGLVAGRLVEEYFLPAVVMEEGQEESRASCRSIPQFDITSALDQCADLLVRHGGHALAAGFTVRNENIPALKDRLTGLAHDVLQGQTLAPTMEIDAEVDIHQVTDDLMRDIQLLEPTGNANPSPTLAVNGVRVLEMRTVGRDDRHLKLKIARAGQPPLDAIGFGLGAWALELSDCADVAFQLEINDWQGRQSLQMNLKDIRPAQGN